MSEPNEPVSTCAAGVEIDMHRVESVAVARTQTRDRTTCHDHDFYELMITGERSDGTKTTLGLTLYTAPGADIGLGPLLSEDAYDSGVCDGVEEGAAKLDRVLARIERLRVACDNSDGTVPAVVALALAALLEGEAGGSDE